MTRILLALALTLCACGPQPYSPPRPDTVRFVDVVPLPPLPMSEPVTRGMK